MANSSETWTVKRNIQIPGLINSDNEFSIKQALRGLSVLISLIMNVRMNHVDNMKEIHSLS